MTFGEQVNLNTAPSNLVYLRKCHLTDSPESMFVLVGGEGRKEGKKKQAFRPSITEQHRPV